MSKKTVKWALVLLCQVTILGLLASPATSSEVERLFWERKWAALDAVFEARGTNDLSPKEAALIANAWWIQGKFEAALELLGRNRPLLPESVSPYADFFIMLGRERMGRKDQARALAYYLWEKGPKELRFYVAYALARMAISEEEKAEWLLAMRREASDDGQRKQALEGLLSLANPSYVYALEMLEIAPLHGKALSILKSLPKPYDPTVSFALGYAAYLKGRRSEAVSLLEAGESAPGKERKARYYRAYALYRLGEASDSVKLWESLASMAGGYQLSSVNRIGIAALEDNAEAREALQRLADMDDEVGAAAISFLASLHLKLGETDKIEGFLDRLSARSDGKKYAAEILWQLGWEKWKERDYKAAKAHFERGIAIGGDNARQAAFLYWLSRAEEHLGNGQRVVSLRQELVKNHPFSFYALIPLEHRDLPFSDRLPDELKGEPDELEGWGFVHWAQKRLASRGDLPSTLRAAQLSAWLGRQEEAYKLATPLSSFLDGASALPKPLMELLYPRPFADIVLAEAKRFGVDPLLVWAIMRQESAFDPNATSWVGAQGLMQLMPSTAEDEARRVKLSATDFYDPKVNVLLGAAHLSRLIERFGVTEYAVAAYNAGMGSVSRWLKEHSPVDEWIEDIPYKETNDYVKKVMANYAIYKSLYGSTGG